MFEPGLFDKRGDPCHPYKVCGDMIFYSEGFFASSALMCLMMGGLALRSARRSHNNELLASSKIFIAFSLFLGLAAVSMLGFELHNNELLDDCQRTFGGLQQC